MNVSIIVPMLNEAKSLALCIKQLKALTPQPLEVIFVDGESGDDSYQIAQSSGYLTLRSPAGRAQQQNTGAAVANGRILLFLHADTILPINAISLLESSLNNNFIWGRFDIRLVSSLRILKTVECMINLRSRWSGIATGDQAIFVLKSEFIKVGGFPSQPLMEDIELSKRLKRLQHPLCLRESVITSTRRWEKRGVWRTIRLMWRLRFLYWLGVPANKLAQAYRHDR
ncbi:MAG: TIGR04283 family arsenosugar biosynthesis glycosyltransferase [Candidatus Saccharibacteria bacterium]|nr:TIGR04283 family arsenosugar biosynthesis glycosyltransferase [Moraxellaceae bacterium]